jgi:predicted DCC family thiol-disulfide oxidoreductase YuxK
MPDSEKIQLLYDRECPVCEFYCQRIDVNDAVGELQLVDAREDSEVLQEITACGLDIDEGMVLKVDEELYYGSEAIHKLATLSTKKGLVNRIGHVLFRRPKVARALYPVLAACRSVLLKILGKTRINNLGIENNERF